MAKHDIISAWFCMKNSCDKIGGDFAGPVRRLIAMIIFL